MAIKTVLNTDIKKKVDVKPFPGYLFSGDANANEITVKITDDGVPATLSGSVHGYVIRKDHKTVVIDGELNATGDEATIILPNSAYSVPGQVSIVIKVGTTTVGACTAIVYESTTMPIVDPGEIVPDISELLAVISDCEEATDEAERVTDEAERVTDEAENVNITSSKSDGIITIVTTDRTGTQTTSTVHDTEIDDTKGFGDTDFVWSADKDAKELDKKAPVIESVIDSSAPVVSFSDGADDMPMEVTVGIEPVQNLHGYEYPWAGGNGKNLFLGWNDTIAGSASWYSKDLPVDMNTNTYYMVSGLDGSHNIMIRAYDSNNTMLGRTTGAARTSIKLSKNSFTSEQASGADFDTISYIRLNYYSWTGITKEALDAIPIQVEIGETATEYEPYSNICPITGHTGTNIIRTGKNLCPIILTDTAVKYGYSATPQADGSVVVQGTWTGISNNVLIKNSSDEDVFVSYRLPAGSYVLTGANSDYYENYGITLQVYNSTDGVQTGREYGDGMSFTFDSEKLVVVRIYIVSSKATNAIPSGGVKIYPMIRLATESDDTYEPFGTTYPITFPTPPGTVYGGTLTVNKDGTGTLIIDTMLKTLDGTERYTAVGSAPYLGYRFITSDMNHTKGELLCSHYKRVYGNYASLVNGSFVAPTTVTQIAICPWEATASDTEQFKAYLAEQYASGTPVQFCYKLATPNEYSLSAQQIRTLFGINNLFCDTGNILSINYPADTKTYIDNQNADSMIADGEASMIATRNYSAGELFTVKSKLYKTTAAVASGEAFVTGTGGNCTETTVADEISAILDSSATGVSF